MLQHAVDRLGSLLPPEQIMVVTAREYVNVLASQVPGVPLENFIVEPMARGTAGAIGLAAVHLHHRVPLENFIVEPMARGTAGAIGLAAVHLHHRDPEALMAVLTADHYIRDVEKFCCVLSAAVQVARDGSIVTLGIEPSFAATGFGYIRRREPMSEVDGFDVCAVDSFIEKPDAARAVEFLESGLHSWNSGMFVWRISRIMGEFARSIADD
jgi:mannose-1-phosphate guanylyltransferase